MSEWFTKTKDGITLIIKVSPGAKKTRLLSANKEAPWIKIAIASPPEKGKANCDLISFLSEMFDISASDCVVLSGHTSTKKRVSVAKKMSYDECLKYLS